MSFQFEPSSSQTICAMVEAICWPMSALPAVTSTMPVQAIEYQTWDRYSRRRRRPDRRQHTEDGGSPTKTSGGGPSRNNGG